MKLLLLFGFVLALATASNVHAHARANLHVAASKLQALYASEAPIIPRPPAHLQTVNATQCIAAWVELADVLNSSCGEVAMLYSPNNTGINVSQIIYDQCVAVDSKNLTCQTKVTTAIIKFSDYCSGDGLAGIDAVAQASLNLWLTMSKIPCIQDDNGNYCYPIFQSHLTAFSAEMDAGSPLTPALLDQICIPCVNKVVNQLAVWGIKDFVALSIQLKIACTKRNDVYCMPTFAQATQVDGIDNATNLALVCSECTRVIAFRLYIANLLLGSSANQTQRDELETFLEFSGFLCQQNNKNQYCYPLIQSYDSSSLKTACGALLLNPSGCVGSECQKQIQKFAGTVGCCFGTWFNWLDFVNEYNQTAYQESFGTVSPTALRTVVSGLCQVPIPLGCAQQKLVVTWEVLNILQDWYTAHKQWFENNFRAVVAYILYVDTSVVVDIETYYDAAKGGIVVTVSVTGFNNQDVAQYKQYLMDHLQITDDANSVLAGIKDPAPSGVSQQTSIAAPITVSAQSVQTTCVDKTCWACSLSTPSFSLLALLLLLLAYMN